jgi:5-oxoprolinase (ATP-hydrolysing) subunit A
VFLQGRNVPINCDLGESLAMAEDGTQTEFLALADWANICCGAHAGSADLTKLTLEQCRRHPHIKAGAHPGYPDPEHFGRRPLFRSPYTPRDVADFVAEQVFSTQTLAREAGVALQHVKPHGALYNEAAADGEAAEAIAQGVYQAAKDLHLVGLAGSVMLSVFRRQGFVAISEGFLDRRYTAEGKLVPRSEPGAMIASPAEALAQAEGLAAKCRTLCIHSDSPGALDLFRALRPERCR